MSFNIGDRVRINSCRLSLIVVDMSTPHLLVITKNNLTHSAVINECSLILHTPAMKHYSGPLTQEEIDEIVQYYDESGYGQINMDLELDEYDEVIPSIIPKTCSHVWKKYIGISQSFHYCTICDAKKDEV